MYNSLYPNVVPTYRPRYRFRLAVTLTYLIAIHITYIHLFSCLHNFKISASLTRGIIHHNGKRTSNTRHVRVPCKLLTYIVCALISLLIFAYLLVLSGDIHPNPGPTEGESSDLSLCSSDIYNFLNLPNHLSTVHYNVQSMANKVDILMSEFSYFDIISFSETWLNEKCSNQNILFPTFHHPERKDRLHDRYGGVILYVKETLSYIRRHDLELNRLECIWIQVKLENKRNILYGVFYRPPSSDSVYNSLIENSIGLAIDSNIPDVIIMGDFNYNVMNPTYFRKVESICNQFSLTQCIEDPTHFTENSSSIIDLLFVTNKDSILTVGAGEPCLDINVRYHCPIYGVFNYLKPKYKSFQRSVWKYENGDYYQLRNDLSEVNWNLKQNDDINIYAQDISATILAKARRSIPNKTIKINPHEPPWMTFAIKRKIRQRKRSYRKAKRSNLPQHWLKFKRLRNEGISLIRQSKQNYLEHLSSKLRTGSLTSRDWWKTLKSFMKPTTSTSLPPLLDASTDTLVVDEIDKANVLNSFFASQSLLDESANELPNDYPRHVGPSINEIVITRAEVLSVLQKLSLGKASGPDGINNRILVEAANELASPLCNLFNQSIDISTLPSSWKTSNVCPIFKKDDPCLPSNYRPVSLLNSMEKVLEKLIFKHVFNYLKDTNFFTPFQSGFLPGDSTINQVTFLYNQLCKALDEGLEFRMIFFDISKAFDRVWHKGLIFKLQAAGIGGKLLSWFSDYLSGRSQKVVIPGGSSDFCSINAGVPQGSILGPLLFLVYINDIVNNIDSGINLFADDTSLSMVVNNPNITGAILQKDIDTINDWAVKWLVKFNPSKSESLIVSRKRNKPGHPNLFMSNIEIPSVQNHKHLGIFISNDGKWNFHVKNIIEKAWKRVNVMRRLKYCLDRSTLQVIYFSFIRPVLEYGDVIWDNVPQYQKEELDKVQNEAARIVTGCSKLVSLANLQKESGWESLLERRRKHKLILFFKMVNGLVPNYLSSLVPQYDNTTAYNLRNSNNLRNIYCRTNLYKKSFLPAVINDWNGLPLNIRNTNSISLFKSLINRDKPKSKKLYNVGYRKVQIFHTRLRNNCSSLNQHLYWKNVIDSPLCSCGSIESNQHYFFECKLYLLIRNTLVQKLSDITTVNLQTILYGNENLSFYNNEIIFNEVHKYILDSKRF